MTPTTYLRVFTLSKLSEIALELRSNLVPLTLATVLDDGLNNSACVVLEYDIFNFSLHDGHEIANVLLTFGRWDIFLACQRPDAFCICEELRMWFSSLTLFLQCTLSFVRFFDSYNIMSAWIECQSLDFAPFGSF